CVFGEWAQGASHNRRGIEWQDHFRKIDYIKGIKIISAADGHGSDKCPYSADGAKLATKVFCNLMAEYYNTYEDINDLEVFLLREGDLKIPRTIDMAWKEEVLDLHRREGRETFSSVERRDISSSGGAANTSASGGAGNGEAGNHILSDEEIIMMYGTTLLGLMITDSYVFSLQIGDGDMIYVDSDTATPLIDADRLLGIETHSLSSRDAWKNAITGVFNKDINENKPYMYMLSTDGFSNSFANSEAYFKTCREYYDMIGKHGIRVIREHLKDWLTETSTYGCGDDITAVFAYVD
ncbi:MAG: protein phosphatase 2C domain-containing protein, partial [Lachnospiraceae bacterium]|nr:protein phosphatase 2C domain-containing protein [Lachnospiraceae bacterium]